MNHHQENIFLTELCLIGLVAFFYTGVLFYTIHIPEIIHENLFNYYLSSHQIFHMYEYRCCDTLFHNEYAYKKHINYVCS